MIPLATYEVKRSLRPALALPLIGFCMVLVYERVHGAWGPAYAQVKGALTLHGDWLRLAVPLLAGAAGGSLAGERRKGITPTLLARGVTRGQYVLSKILGAGASGAILMAAAICGFYVLVGILWPAGCVTWERNESGPGPVPALYMVNPLANDLLLAAMSMVAAAAWSIVSVLAGTLTTNRYAAMAAPMVLFIVSVVLQAYGVNRLLNPYTYLDLQGHYTHTIPVLWRPYAAFLYWSCLAVILAMLSRWIFAQKELT